MNMLILVVTIMSVLVIQDPCDAQSFTKRTPADTPKSPISTATGGQSGELGQTPAKQPQQSVGGANPPATSVTSIAVPADIASLTAKEILSANNQVVGQIASMYQYFGLFITIIMTLVGAIAAWVSYLGRKSVQDFIREWTRKLDKVDSEMKNALTRLYEAANKAEVSASKAEGNAQLAESNLKILDKALKDYDQLQSVVASLRAQIGGEQQALAPSTPAEEAGPLQPARVPSEAEEDAEVAARLKDKIIPAEGED